MRKTKISSSVVIPPIIYLWRYSLFTLIPQEAKVSIRFFRGVNPENKKSPDEEQSSPMEQVKIEFESIKSLISERANGRTRVAVKDFRKASLKFNQTNFIN